MAGSGRSVYYADFMKWLILFLVLWLVWRAMRSARPPARPAARSRAGEVMRACAHCGLNVPQSEAVNDGTADYCSEAHRRLGPAAARK
jgi:uncharacterized protein